MKCRLHILFTHTQACQNQLRSSLLVWLQAEALRAADGAGDAGGGAADGESLDEAADAPDNERLKQLASGGLDVVLKMLGADYVRLRESP